MTPTCSAISGQPTISAETSLSLVDMPHSGELMGAVGLTSAAPITAPAASSFVYVPAKGMSRIELKSVAAAK